MPCAFIIRQQTGIELHLMLVGGFDRRHVKREFGAAALCRSALKDFGTLSE